MKTPEEFRDGVFRKRVAYWKKRRRTAVAAVLLCIPLAAGGVWSASYLAEHPGGIPALLPARIAYTHSTQVLDSAQPQDLGILGGMAADWDKSRKLLGENALDPEFSRAVNAFARESSALLCGKFQENACYSPASLYLALSLAGSGAQGDTLQEFLDVLHMDSLDLLQDQCGKFYRLHSRDNPQSQFRLANSLWLDQRTKFEPQFLDTAQESFYADLFQADFTDPDLGKDMGSWISKNTEGLLAPDIPIDPENQRLALLNTIYYRAPWRDEFYEKNNTQEEFTKKDGSTVECTFLNRSWGIGAGYQGDGFRRASLPLSEQGSLLGEMIFVLPDEDVSPWELLQDPEAFAAMFEDTQGEERYEVHWSIPKFSFHSEYDLMETLQGLGLDTALNPLAADFSGISSEQLFLSSASQGVHIGIDEDGVEAAAYTELGMAAGGAEFSPDILEMKLDRPFLFAVRTSEMYTREETASGTLLFVGVCGDPTSD